jgi:hypothetical protein
MSRCQCEAQHAAKGGVQGQLVISMKVMVHEDSPSEREVASEVYTDWEASTNFYRDALSFDSEKFFEPWNRSVHMLSYSSLLDEGQGVVEMDMRLRYHPATCEGGLVSVGIPTLRACSIGGLSCKVAHKGPVSVEIPTGRARDWWATDTSTAACVTLSTLFLLFLIITTR